MTFFGSPETYFFTFSSARASFVSFSVSSSSSTDTESFARSFPLTWTTTSTTSQTMRLNYDSLCSDNNIKSAVKIIGYIILVIKWIVPLIIIVLGMIDFGKAAISNDEKAVNKATGALIRRFIAGIVIFFIPTIIMAALNAIQISKGIEKDTNTTFGACTKCLFDPVNSCSVVNNTTTGSN